MVTAIRKEARWAEIYISSYIVDQSMDFMYEFIYKQIK